MPRLRLIVGLLLLAVVAATGYVFRAPLFRAAVASVAGAATGSRVAFDTLQIDGRTIDARGVNIERGSGLRARIARIVVHYHLHDLVFGGPQRFGLDAIAIDRPEIFLQRRPDGSFDVGSLGSAAASSPAPAGTATQTPFVARVVVRDGTIELRDPARRIAGSRDLSVSGVDVSATFDTRATSTYAGTARVPGDAAARFAFSGRIDRTGFAVHHVRATAVALPAFVNYFINSPTAEVLGGTLVEGNVRAYSFGASTHVAGRALVRDAAMRIPGIVPAARAMNGTIDFYDNGIATPRLRARLGTLETVATGGLYGFDQPAPVFRLAIVAADAPLERARRLFTFSQALPLRGAAHIATLLEGPAPQPVVITQVAATAPSYGTLPFADLAGRALLYDGVVCVDDTHARYDGLDVGAGGTIEAGDVAQSDLVLTVDGPAVRVPYAAQIAPHATIHGIGRIAGTNLKLDALGELYGATPNEPGAEFGGVLHIDPLGDGTFGPLYAVRPGGASLAGTFYLDRAANQSAFWVDARAFPFVSLAPAPRFPGLDVYPPDFDATLDGSVAGLGPPSDFRIAGHLHAHDLRVAKLTLGDVAANVTGHIGNLRGGDIVAHGAWGTLTGRGAYVGSQLAVAGAYRGSFEQLRTFTGDLGAHGPLDGPVSLMIDPARTVVQSTRADVRGSRVRGVPLETIAGTLAVTRGRLRLFAANAAVASGTFAAAGTLATARTSVAAPGGIGVSVSGADAARLHALAPIDGGGAVATIGRFRNAGASTRYDGGVVVSGVHVQRIALAGSGDVGLAGTRLDFAHTTALAGGAVAELGGSLTSLGTKRPHYDAHVTLTETALGPIASVVAPGRRDVAGTIAGDFTVSGTTDDLAVHGRFAVPEGSVAGLAFRDASARIAIAPDGVGARDGTVTIGTTTARFGGFFRAGDGGFRIDAPHADLSDFNDLFDTGDTLGGRGHVRGRFVKRRGVVRTNADVAIQSLKYRTFDLGNATAHWVSRGTNVTGTIGFGGRSGRLDTAGTLGLAAHAPLDELLARSRFSGDAHLRGLDLGVWLPALGYQLPVTGRIDADATIAGVLRDPDVRTSATLSGGTIGKFPVDRFAIVASSTLSRTTVQSLELDVPSFALSGSGSFGLGSKDPIALRLHAKSPNVGTLLDKLIGLAYPLSGTGEADVAVDGTRASPQIAGGFDLEGAVARGIAVPRALGEFSIRGRDLVLSDVEVGFTTGSLSIAGSLPLEVAPFALGPAAAPVELDLSAKDIALANFAPLFPSGSTLKGMLEGRINVAGTAGAPRLDGTISLMDGAATTPFETVPITGLGATLAFAGTSVTLRDVRAAAGGGTLVASGSGTLLDLVHLGADATYRFDARAHALRLDLPAYGSGTVDGTLAFAHAPGAPRTLSGKLSVADGTIPFAALLLAGDAAASPTLDATPAVAAPAPTIADLALDLDVAADRNVRVRSANVDLGGEGTLHIGGTLTAPKLSGGFDSTGGTLTYFNTVFRVIDGRVSFVPDRGVIPDLTAHAVTHVIDPDPNTVRNVSGSADVTLDIHGPVTGLSIGLTSDPSYDREQILGLLLDAPALGATNLFDTPGQATLYGSNTPGVGPRDTSAYRAINGTTTVAQEAFGVANAQFTRTLLAPAETAFAKTLNLTNFNVNVDLTGNVGLQARKVLGKEVSAVYGTTIGYPYRQTFGFEVKPNPVTAYQLTAFQTFGNAGLTSLNPSTFGPGFGSTRLTSTQPSSGTVGFSLSLQRLFR